MRTTGWLPIVAAGWMLAACGGPGSTVRPDETSVEGHRDEAARERAAAAEALSRENRPPMVPVVSGSPLDPVLPHDRPEDLRAESRWRLEHAQDHEEAARALERFEADE